MLLKMCSYKPWKCTIVSLLLVKIWFWLCSVVCRILIPTDQGLNPVSPAWAGRFFTAAPPGNLCLHIYFTIVALFPQ